MQCPKCHTDIGEGSNFCPKCGFDLKAEKKEKESEAAPEGEKDRNGDNEKTGQTRTEAGSSMVSSPLPSASGGKAGNAEENAAKPKGSIAGTYIAGMVVIIIICIIALVLGIVTTVNNAQIAQAASQADQSFSDSSSSSQGSSSSSSSPSDAQTYLSDAQNCSNVNSSNSLNETNATNSYEFSVTGTDGWGPIMTCVAKDLYMPLPDQTKIKNFINEDVSSQITSSATSTLEWKLQDGSSIFATYTAPLNGNGGWVVNFNDVEPASASSSSAQ